MSAAHCNTTTVRPYGRGRNTGNTLAAFLRRPLSLHATTELSPPTLIDLRKIITKYEDFLSQTSACVDRVVLYKLLMCWFEAATSVLWFCCWNDGTFLSVHMNQSGWFCLVFVCLLTKSRIQREKAVWKKQGERFVKMTLMCAAQCNNYSLQEVIGTLFQSGSLYPAQVVQVWCLCI